MDMKILAMFMSVILFGVALEVTNPIDVNKIRWGNFAHFDEDKNHKVGVVNSTKVYENIPEYKIIVKENLDKKSARYTHLMIICTKKFKEALTRVGILGGYQIIVEIGGVSDYPSKDVTQEVIAKL